MQHPARLPLRILFLAASTSAYLLAQSPPAASFARFPDTPGKEATQKVCSGCHGPDLILQKAMTKEGWAQVVASMVARGAKGTDDELAQVVTYLARSFPPGSNTAVTKAPPAGPSRRNPKGPDDKQVVDPVAADRGKILYQSACASCHGANTRGTANGPDLVRSLVALHDRYGDQIGPALAKGHPPLSVNIASSQIVDLSHFIHQKFNDTLRTGPFTKVINVLTGDPKAGEAYFNGAGTCTKCHSSTGDLAGIAKKYDPPTLQQRFLFPRTVGLTSAGGMARSKPVMLTVTPASGKAVTGVLVSLDDFDVSLRDAAGEYHSWKRVPGLTVEKNDPYAAHNALLDQYKDTDIHNVVAYLETLK